MYGIEAGRLVGAERGRSGVEPRSLLVYEARERGGIKGRVLAEHLHRDAPMISQLYAASLAKPNMRSVHD